MQMAKLLWLILLVDLLWPVCWRRDSSHSRRRRLAAGNFSVILGEEEHDVNKANAAHSHLPALPRKVGDSSYVEQLSR